MHNAPRVSPASPLNPQRFPIYDGTTSPFVLGAVEEILRVECHQWELPNKAVHGDTRVVDGSWRERTLRKAKGKWHGSRQAE